MQIQLHLAGAHTWVRLPDQWPSFCFINMWHLLFDKLSLFLSFWKPSCALLVSFSLSLYALTTCPIVIGSILLIPVVFIGLFLVHFPLADKCMSVIDRKTAIERTSKLNEKQPGSIKWRIHKKKRTQPSDLELNVNSMEGSAHYYTLDLMGKFSFNSNEWRAAFGFDCRTPSAIGMAYEMEMHLALVPIITILIKNWLIL